METKLATQTKQADVVIVGGGLAGLTAAVYLARAGAGVMVFEKSMRLGGRSKQDARGVRVQSWHSCSVHGWGRFGGSAGTGDCLYWS
jgi:monoamine oxidase